MSPVDIRLIIMALIAANQETPENCTKTHIGIALHDCQEIEASVSYVKIMIHRMFKEGLLDVLDDVPSRGSQERIGYRLTPDGVRDFQRRTESWIALNNEVQHVVDNGFASIGSKD